MMTRICLTHEEHMYKTASRNDPKCMFEYRILQQSVANNLTRKRVFIQKEILNRKKKTMIISVSRMNSDTIRLPALLVGY